MVLRLSVHAAIVEEADGLFDRLHLARVNQDDVAAILPRDVLPILHRPLRVDAVASNKKLNVIAVAIAVLALNDLVHSGWPPFFFLAVLSFTVTIAEVFDRNRKRGDDAENKRHGKAP